MYIKNTQCKLIHFQPYCLKLLYDNNTVIDQQTKADKKEKKKTNVNDTHGSDTIILYFLKRLG